MAKGVKKIKWIGNSGALRGFSKANSILCIRPNQTAPFVVDEWYNDTTEEDKRRNITWLWMDQKKRNTFNKTVKPAGVPFGVNLPKKLCGSYAFYLEASLYGGHDHRNTGLHVYGKCEEKITASSWSKTKGTADKSEINYGHDLFITLETEGVNGDTLTLKLYSDKKTDSIQTVKAKCINGKIRDAKFTTMPCFMAIPGLPNDLEKFHIKVLDITGKHLTDASGKDKVLSFSIKNKRVPPVFETPTNNTPFRIGETPKEEEIKTEGIIKAYFAKEEFTKETTEVDGQHVYTFASKNVKFDKNNIAGIIKKKVDAQVKANKKYTKLDDIKNALTEKSYSKGDTVSFNLYKLGANFIKINSAPLEEEVYVVAKTFLLDGKEVTITIKEKDAIVVDADADMPVTEAKENGAELTTLKATVEDGIARVKVKLRPKADEDLKKWKEKLAGNKKDGTHKYTVKNAFTVSGDLDAIAASIEKKSNTALAPNHIVKKEEIKSLLTEGASYTITNSFEIPKYKKEKITEMLWLKAECQGDTLKHEGEFLKKDGEYFVIGKKCECEARIRAFMRTIRVAEGTGEYFKGTKDARDPQLGYTTWFSGSGNNFTLSDDHPRTINHNSTETVYSSAAGAYQTMSWKFDELNGYEIERHNDTFRTVIPKVYTESRDKAKKYDAKGFSEVSQDKLCVIILKDSIKVIDVLLKKDIKGAISKSSGTWVSLPGATAGQPTAKMQETLDYYDEFLKEELAGKSHLHIKSGFLKEFDITCNCGNESSSAWHNPLDRMELRGWYSETQFTPGKSDFHGRTGGKHDGLDLYAPVGTTIYAAIDGEITYSEDPNGYGHRTFLEGNYNGEKYFLMYCHLSEYVTGKVKAGDPIGKTGQSGNASGQAAKMDHLHFEVRKVKMTKPSFDPLTEISELGRDVVTNPDQNTQTGQ